MKLFQSADILLPDLEDFSNWAVVACDQYSSAPEYWNEIYENVKEQPSTLHMILPEAWLNTPKEKEHQDKIEATMRQYLDAQVFKTFPDSFIYVERTLTDGSIRKGLVGAVNLDAYDYHCPSDAPIRATEATILERIPPRAAIRSKATIEFPHILLLQNDAQDRIFEGLASIADSLPVVYDFDLMAHGGHIIGRLVAGEAKAQTEAWIEAYENSVRERGENLFYAIGDGNHSLAAAKSVWMDRNHDDPAQAPSRFALAELENLQDDAQKFEPIHRILKNVDVNDLLASFDNPSLDDGYDIDWISGDNRGTIRLDASLSPLPLAVLQNHLDAYLAEHEGEIDYIHGEKDLEDLAAKDNSIGFFLPAIDKDSFFEAIQSDGSLPRKTFSMGHAHEKRYYLEGRKLFED